MGALRKKFPRPVLALVCVALLTANTINIGADLSAMADAAELLTGIDSHVLVVVFAVAITAATIRLHYATIANILKWLALVLFAYVVTAIRVGPDWSTVFRDTFVPRFPSDSAGWQMIVAILGTTISPYLFFWQASEEVEEELVEGRRSLAERRGATRSEILTRRIDVGIGTFFSNLAMFFIILTTAMTLHRNGITQLTTSREVAEALRPLAGDASMLLYTIGIIGTGALAIPTLSGSAAYAFADAFGWRGGMDESWQAASAFYAVIIASTSVGVALDFANVNPVSALYWSAVINGLLAPILLIGILAVASDPGMMAGQPGSRVGRAAVALTAAAMAGAVVAMFVV